MTNVSGWKMMMLPTIALLMVMSFDRTSATAGGNELDPQRQIIWHDEDTSRPVFLPAVLLEEHELSDLPLTPRQKEDIERWIEQHRNPERYFPPFVVARGVPCMENLSGPSNVRAEDAGTLDDLVRQAPVAVLGQVTAIVHGKDDMLSGIGRLVYVEVKELVHVHETARSSAPKVGELVAVLKEGGTVKVGGVTVCEQISSEFQQPEIGDWLLVLGDPSSTGSPLMGNSKTFPIEDDQVIPQPYFRLRASEGPRQLRVIRSSLQVGS